MYVELMIFVGYLDFLEKVGLICWCFDLIDKWVKLVVLIMDVDLFLECIGLVLVQVWIKVFELVEVKDCKVFEIFFNLMKFNFLLDMVRGWLR